MKKALLVAFITIMLLTACSQQGAAEKPAGEITVSAAASLKEPLDEIVKMYMEEANVKAVVNYGSSGTLQKQIEEGAPVDLFISAGRRQVDALMDKGIADKESYKELLANSLVLVVSYSYDKDIKDIMDLKDRDIKLAIGETGTVPAGQYAKDFLDNTALWNVFDKKLVFAKDVKAVLSYVEAGDAHAGLVYCSDAVKLKNSYVAYEIPADKHNPIIYPMVIIKASKNAASAEAFTKYLGEQKCREIFEKYKFKVK
ncbi:MAG: molybdate ABC transporter substrate-binding protein [Bacillota bacterium]